MKAHILTAAFATAIAGQLFAETPRDTTSTADSTTTADLMPATDSVKTTVRYPERLLTDFPVIYADTAYSAPGYHVVVRAIWMSKRGRRCKVTTSPDLPAPTDTPMVRFVTH